MKLASTAQPTLWSFLEGGMTMAMNIPYSATLNAATIFVGNAPPANMPHAVPEAQKRVEIKAALNV